jgi:hypothetical protein
VNASTTRTSRGSQNWLGYYRRRPGFSRVRVAVGKMFLNSFQKIVRREIAVLVRGLLREKEAVSLISLGSGVDFIAYHLKKEFRDRVELTVFDISPECVARNRELFPGLFSYTVGDIFSHDFDGKRYDIVYNTGLLEHFPVPEQKIIFARIISILDAPGYFATVNPYCGGRLYIRILDRLRRLKKWEYGEETPLKSLAPFSTRNFTLVKEYPCCSLMQLSFLRRVNIPGYLLSFPVILFSRLCPSEVIDRFCGRFLGYYALMSLFRKRPDEIHDRRHGNR